MDRHHERMRHLHHAIVATALGTGCSPTHHRTEAPTATHDPPPHATAPHDEQHPEGRHHEHHHAGGHHHAFTDAEAWTKVFDDPARDAWQRPDQVLRALDLTPTMTVADIGAGTGYFAIRLARAVPQGEVIATDVEPDMVRFIHERAHREGLANLRAVRATHEASGLAPQSVDRILVVNVWHHLGDRDAYARDLAAALEPGGRVLVVEFHRSARRGPPEEMRIAPEEIVATFERAGLTARVFPVPLPDQYIVEAQAKP